MAVALSERSNAMRWRSISTLFVDYAGIVGEISNKDIQDVFKKYGDIFKIVLKDDQSWFRVTFKHTRSAFRAMEDSLYLQNVFAIKVYPAEEWHQPPVTESGLIDERPRIDDEEEYVPNVIGDQNTLMSLNDDCLVSVMMRLKLADLITMESVNKRMRALCPQAWATKKRLRDRQVDFSPVMSIQKLRPVLVRCGRYLKHITIDCSGYHTPDVSLNRLFDEASLPPPTRDYWQDRLVREIVALCPNLQHFHSNNISVNDELICRMSGLICQLLSFQMNENEIGTRFSIWLNEKAVKLTKLRWQKNRENFLILPIPTLRSMSIASGSFAIQPLLKMFPNLEELLGMEIVVNNNPLPENNLKELRVWGQTENVFQVMFFLLCNLSSLRIFSYHWVEHVSLDMAIPATPVRSENLTELHLHNRYLTGAEMVRLSAILKGQLIKLCLVRCRYLAPHDLMEFMHTQPNLRLLSMPAVLSPFPVGELEEFVKNRECQQTLTVNVGFDHMVSNEPLLKLDSRNPYCINRVKRYLP